MITIRLQRVGRRGEPAYRIVAQDSRRSSKSGRVVELLGSYNPKQDSVNIKADRATDWIQKGAKVSDTVHNLFISEGVLKGKKKNVLPRKSPIIPESEEVEEKEKASDQGESLKQESEVETKSEDSSAEAEEKEQNKSDDGDEKKKSDKPDKTKEVEEKEDQNKEDGKKEEAPEKISKKEEAKEKEGEESGDKKEGVSN